MSNILYSISIKIIIVTQWRTNKVYSQEWGMNVGAIFIFQLIAIVVFFFYNYLYDVGVYMSI